MDMPYLHQLVISGQTRALKEELRIHDNPNILEPAMGNSPLHLAAQQDDHEMAQALVESGCFVNLQTPHHGVTPLMIAVWHRKPAVVEYLLGLADINIEIQSTFGIKAEQLIDFGVAEIDEYGQEQKSQMERAFAHYRQRLSQEAAKMGAFQLVTDPSLSDSEKARQLEAMTAESLGLNLTSAITCSGNDEHTAVMVAARDGLTQSLGLLMEQGADQTIPDHYMRAIPLHKAAYNGHADVIELLANYPGFKETLNAQGPNNGYTPLHDAIWHGHVDAARVLLEKGADKSLRGFDGKTPLELAQAYQYADIEELFRSPG